MFLPHGQGRGGDQERQAATAQEPLRGAIPRQRSGAVAKMSYPTSKVRAGSWEELPHIRDQGQWPRWATPRPRSGPAAERSYPTSEIRGSGQDELPHVQGQGRQLRGATPGPRSGAAAERSNSTSKEQRVHGHRRAEKSYSKFKRGNLVQGKEQQLCFAGAAIKIYPTFKVKETQVRR